jgi:hypothetical protein
MSTLKLSGFRWTRAERGDFLNGFLLFSQVTFVSIVKGLAQSFHSKSNFNSVAKEEIRPHFKGVGADFVQTLKTILFSSKDNEK